MTIREAGKNAIMKNMGKQPYRIGFNDEDETELDASSMKELEELWESLCPEFGCEPDSVDYVEWVSYAERL